MSTVLLALSLAVLARQEPLAPQEVEPGRTWKISGPEWDEACAAASVAVPAALDIPWWPSGLGSWRDESHWRAWLELLRAESQVSTPDPERRIALALAARAAGRDQAAWEHLSFARNDPSLLARVLPAFLPNVTGFGDACNFVSAPSVTYSLAPALPPIPSIEPGIPGKPPEAEVLGFEVGDARLSLRVVLEADGTQIDLHHVGGAPIALWVQMPTPPGVSIGALYVDWAEVENRAFPPRVELSAENPEATLWGRFIPHRAAWPTTIPDQISAQLERGGLHLILPNEEYIFDPHRLFGESLAELLGVPLVVSDRPPAPTDGIAPLVISFVGEYDAPTGKAADDAKLAALITATERFVLNQHH